MRSAFVNGKIYTQFFPVTVYDAIIIEDKKIIFAGDSKRALNITDSVIDLHGKVIMPGFIDAHLHIDELGQYLNILDLRGTKSIKELREKLREFASSHRGPIMGHGWDQELFEENRWPDKKDIDDIVNDRPVILTRICIHAALVNTYFIDSLKFKSDSGLVREGDFEYFRKNFNELIPAEAKEKYVLDAIDHLLKNGITTVGFVSCSKEIFEVLKKLDLNNRLKIKINVYLNAGDFGNVSAYESEHLKIKGIKLFVDGSLGVRTALLSERYNDADTVGEQVTSVKDLKFFVNRCFELNGQVAIHAIGDGAMDIAISVLKNMGNGNRIEHCSVIRDDQIDKLTGINLVVQPHFIISDFWVIDRIGKEKARYAYRFADLMNRGLNLAFSTDAPVEPVNPFLTLYAAVTRGEFENIALSEYTEDQKLSLSQALHSYTLGSSKALNEPGIGSLENGNFADFIVLDRDPFSISSEELPSLKVKEVYLSGERVI